MSDCLKCIFYRAPDKDYNFSCCEAAPDIARMEIPNAVCVIVDPNLADWCDNYVEIENKILKSKITGSTSDGYHTFDELYYHRMCLFACIVNNFPKSWKAKKHFDGSMYEEYFIVGIETPNGQATYHYANEYWNLFKCRVLDNAPEWDDHTPNDVCKRIISLNIALDIELLSSRIHTLWSNWFLHQRDLSTEYNLARWNKQAHTRYEDLSDADKEKDRKIVKNLLFEVLSGESEEK